jgi:hypothetical protein
VIVIIGNDDPETEHVARAAAARHRRTVRVVMDHHVPKNKPKALNTALPACLPACRGDTVGVFDAEDEARFEESAAAWVASGRIMLSSSLLGAGLKFSASVTRDHRRQVCWYVSP